MTYLMWIFAFAVLLLADFITQRLNSRRAVRAREKADDLSRWEDEGGAG